MLLARAAMMQSESGQDFLVAFERDAVGSIASFGFQSPTMGRVFVRFPRVLLLHRLRSEAQRVLYIFLAAEPTPVLCNCMARVVHFAVPRDESPAGLACMYRVFRAFNPTCTRTRLLLTAPDLPQLSALAQAFPDAELQLSLFHLCKSLQQQIQGLGLEEDTEHLMLSTLRHAVWAGTERSRRKVWMLLKDLVVLNKLPQFHVQWLVDNRIWAMHRERTWANSSSYFRDLEIVTGGLSKIFSAELCLERCITSLGQYYQQCVFKNLPDAKLCFIPHPDDCPGQAAPQSLLAPGPSLTPLPCQDQPLQCPVQVSAQQQQLVPMFPTMTEIPVIAFQSLPAAPQLTALQHQPESPQVVLQSELTSPQFLLDPSSTSSEPEAIENTDKGSVKEINRGTEERIKQSLSEICTEPAARLCLSEFAVVQKSVQVISVAEDGFSVQILEDAHSVSLEDQRSCTCHFSQAFQLPCRHILALLRSEKRTVQPDMLGAQWQKGQDAHQAGQDSADGLLEILESSWDESLDKSLLVSFLTAEVSRLLTCCSGTEFECRYRTLRELADSWIGPYIVVKL